MPLSDLIFDLNRWQLAVTAVVFVLCVGAEQLWPQVRGRDAQRKRWIVNLLLFGVGFGALLLLAPWIQQLAVVVDRFIPFPPLVSMGLPVWLLILVSFLLIDVLAYLTHLTFHSVPLLWRLHRTHHSDPLMDASTGVRHHPLEAIVGGVAQFCILAILGVPLLVILGYGVVAGVWQFVTHMDVALPEPIDRVARLVIVTPGMHRVHHSVRMDEGNSNFGMILSIWDRLFGTYRRRAVIERCTMALGVGGFVPATDIVGSLREPFRR
ncbi:sterol desaturase family protein [Brevundimonas sp. DC300-4]|uniref:sterol desaturase family protein n=1 Tax=Brevundimonas sp. DC300-4 TaxID=2804594 RepID=UPI003CEAF273